MQPYFRRTEKWHILPANLAHSGSHYYVAPANVTSAGISGFSGSAAVVSKEEDSLY